MFTIKNKRAVTGLLVSCLAIVCVSCGDAPEEEMTSGVEAGHFSSQLNPCDIVTKTSVATTFGIPAAKLEQSGFSRSCDYSWEGNNEALAASVYIVGISENAKKAAAYFANATRSMSAEEVSNAMNKVRDQVQEEEVLDTASEKQAAEGIFTSIGKNGFNFVEVAGIGDQARFDTNTGELNVLVDNLHFTVSAYRGPNMPMPDKLTPSAIMEASNNWIQETLEQRKQATIKLAKAAVAKL